METAKYDVVYGRLLKLGIEIEKAKFLAKVLIDISERINLSLDQLLKGIGPNGIKFDNDVYIQLNRARTNSSQIGYIDRSNIPLMVTSQLAGFGPLVLKNDYVDIDYVDPEYVE